MLLSSSLSQLGINDDIKILILGGSQAAKIFADILPPILKKLKNTENSLKVYQQCQNEQNIVKP